MPFAYYARLSAVGKQIYRKSDAIGSIGLPPQVNLMAEVAALRDALLADDRLAVQRASQAIVRTSALHTNYSI